MKNMNILIVDDEYYIVKGIVENTDWTKLGIERQFAAYSARQARQILEGPDDINILLTDIEMPRESGLDLVEWMNENNFHPVILALTGHQRFDYAQTALNLHIFSYLLKPIEPSALEEALQNAILQADALRMQQESKQALVEKKLEESGDLISTIKCYIQEHLSDTDLNRQQIADEIHINPDYMSHLFHKKTGVSLVSYISEQRINTAKKLLATTMLSLQQIAERVGFSNSSYFHRQFKKTVGITPQQYRTERQL